MTVPGRPPRPPALLPVSGRDPSRTLPLPQGATVVGRATPGLPAPDIDLGPDATVAPHHARLHCDGPDVSIESLGDGTRTRVEGIDITRMGVVPLRPGQLIEIGECAFVLASADTWRLRHGDMVVDLELPTALNYSLQHTGLLKPPRAWLWNAGERPSAPGALTVAVEHCGSAVAAVPSVAPQQRVAVTMPALAIDSAMLERQVEHTMVRVSVALGETRLAGGPTHLALLPHNEWSLRPEHRLSLAAFVLPNHPTVAGSTIAAVGSSRQLEAESALTHLYQHLAEGWHLAYRDEPPGASPLSQRIRLPHQILPEMLWAARQGEGTCLDLALLFAGCLERLGLQPLVAVLEVGDGLHALVGCWREARATLEPVVDDTNALERACWLEPTGCTRDPKRRLSFAEARAAAHRALEEGRLRFALDVAAARLDGVRPLPLAGEPGLGPAVLQVLERARVLAEQQETTLSTVPLMLALLMAPSGLARSITHSAGCAVDLDAAMEAAIGRLAVCSRPGMASQHYLGAIELARARAKADGSPLVLEAHLLMALLEIQSAALDRMLGLLEVEREALRSELRRAIVDPLASERSAVISVFLS